MEIEPRWPTMTEAVDHKIQRARLVQNNEGPIFTGPGLYAGNFYDYLCVESEPDCQRMVLGKKTEESDVELIQIPEVGQFVIKGVVHILPHKGNERPKPGEFSPKDLLMLAHRSLPIVFDEDNNVVNVFKPSEAVDADSLAYQIQTAKIIEKLAVS